MNFLTIVALVIVCILLIVQLVFIILYRGRYIQLREDTHNLNRALKIVRNQLIDSERERKWLNNQIAILANDAVTKNMNVQKGYIAELTVDQI